MSTPQEDQYDDLFQIRVLFDELCQLLKETSINLKGLFLNADPDFDPVDFLAAYKQEEVSTNVKEKPRSSEKAGVQPYANGTHVFDEQLYADRPVINHVHA